MTFKAQQEMMREMAQQLTQTITHKIAQKKSKESIYQELLEQGEKVDAINAAYELLDQEHDKEDTNRKTIQTIVYLGALLIGVGIFSFIASNWSGMDRMVKIIVILVSMIAANSMGWWLKETRNFTKTGEACYFLGTIIFGAGIFLVAQMFHIRAGWTDGFLLWLIGTLAMGMALESWTLYYAAVVLGFISTIGTPFAFLQTSFGIGSQHISTVILVVSTIVTFVSGYRIRKKLPASYFE